MICKMVSEQQLKSQPLEVFESNLEHLMRLYDLRRGYMEHVQASMRKDLEKIARLPQETQSKAEINSILASLPERANKWLEIFQTTFPFLNVWELVMLVSFTEAYLEDVLILLVQKNPRWMQESDQKASYSEVSQAASIPELLGRMQRRWAKNVMNGTPQNWIERLEGFGARGYAAGLSMDMAEVWNRRHITVHSPRTSAHITSAEFGKALNIVKAFIEPTDKFVIRLLAVPSLLPET
jgi:hypothetical protein